MLTTDPCTLRGLTPSPGSPATGRKRYKFSRKADSFKEIEDWAKEGRGDQRADVTMGRNSGTQLSDNVTQERMLKAQIMDLSKERYKFLNHVTYEKRVFLERQQRKSAALRERLKGVSAETTRGPTPSYATGNAAHGRSLTAPTYLQRAPQTPLHPNPAGGIVTAGDGDASRTDRPGERAAAGQTPTVAPEATQERPATVPNWLGSASTESMDSRPLQTPPIFQTEAPPTAASRKRYSGPGRGGLPMLTTPARTATTVRFAPTDSLTPAGAGLDRARSKPHKKKGKSAVTEDEAVPREAWPIHDPRYTELHAALCANYRLGEPGLEDVDAIIARIRSLQVSCQSAARREAGGSKRPRRLALRVQQFMRERGLVFA